MKEKFIPPFRRFVLQNFPFIEHDFDALTSYQLWSKVVEYLNKVIHSQNEVTAEMQQLYDYVSHYFDNLDVQDEIDNKLDEMVEDGTLQEIITAYIQANVTWTFDTVAELKTATNLVDGSFAQTLGYRNINDGGASIYKIVDNDELIDDGGSIIELDNGLKATLIVNNTIRIAQFGIDGNHADNIDNFVTYVNSTNLISTIEFESGIEYTLDTEMIFSKKDLKIKGNGATIKLTATKGYHPIFNVTATNSCIVDNINIDGSDMPQDQWDIEVFADLYVRICFNITAPTIDIENTNIKNVWGYGMRLLGYDNVIVKNCNLDKIGGCNWFTDAQTSLHDSLGDGIYLSGHNNDANVLIENCNIVGYINSDTTKNNSRCGICFENLEDYTLTGKITNARIVNTIIKNFSRFLHHEAYTSVTKMSFENCEILNCVCCISTNIDYTDLKMDNCTIEFDDRNITYAGTAGIRRFNGLIENSKLVSSTGTVSKMCMDSNLTYNNCKLSNIHGLLNENAYYFLTNNCDITFNDSYDGSYFNYSTRAGSIYKNTTFNKTTQVVSSTMNTAANVEIYNCTFNNIFPAMRFQFMDNNSKIYMSSEPANFASLKRMNWASASIYVNNVLISKPNINTTLPQSDYASGCRGYGTTYIAPNLDYKDFSGSTLPIIPATLPQNITLKNNSKYLMIMYASTDIAQIFSNNFANVYYTDLTFNNSGVASIGTINTKGTIASANQITFDTGAGTASCGTNNAKYMVWILPYEYKYILGLE